MSWGVNVLLNPWFSLGVHIDHTKPYIALHLPGRLVLIGRQVDTLGDEGVIVCESE